MYACYPLRHVLRTSFLPPTYNNTHLHIRSTDVDRCLMSVTSALQQLYPATLIPIHVIPQEQDVLLQPTDKCASYVLSYRDRLEEMDVAIQEYAEVIQNIRVAAGWDATHHIKMSSPQVITTVHDNMVCELAHGIHTPAYITQHTDLIHNLTRRIIHHRFAPQRHDVRGTVGDGLFSDMIANVENRILAQGGAAKQAMAQMTVRMRAM